MRIACKFGGTSVATAENIRKCKQIVENDKNRKIVVVSAPGKKNKNGKKVTDLLLECYKNRFEKEVFDCAFNDVRSAFYDIATLVDFPIEEELSALYAQMVNSEANLDFVLSRGEYLNAKIISKYFGYEFLDASRFIRFKNGELDLNATLALAQKVDTDKNYVIPGCLRAIYMKIGQT